MNPADLLARARALGIRVYLDDLGRLQAEVPDPTPDHMEAVLDELRRHKDAVKAYLRTWPRECLEVERLYHQPPVLVAPHARLYALVGQKVLTPRGAGNLLQVFLGLAVVVLDGQQRAVVVEPDEVRPLVEAQ